MSVLASSALSRGGNDRIHGVALFFGLLPRCVSLATYPERRKASQVQWAHSILSRISSTQQPVCGVRETAQRLPVGVYLRPIGERNVGVHVKRRTGQCRRVIAEATDLVVNYLVVITLIRHPGLINKAVVHR